MNSTPPVSKAPRAGKSGDVCGVHPSGPDWQVFLKVTARMWIQPTVKAWSRRLGTRLGRS